MIAIILVSLLFVWWMDLSLSSTKEAIITTQQIEESQGIQVRPEIGPVDYSKQKVEEINEATLDRAEEIEKTIP